MNRKEHIERITDALGSLAYRLEAKNSISLYDINIHAEDFFKGLLNLIFGYNLENINIADGKNTAAIDLGDIDKRIAVQVTSDKTPKKIRTTIEKFLKKNLFENYERLTFLIIKIKKKDYRPSFNTQEKFQFNKKEDIIFIEDLLLKIRDLEVGRLKEISSYLDAELLAQNNSESNEVETICDLIHFLSNNKKYNKLHEEREPDPEHKIYKRFSDYSTHLTNCYKDLAPIYSIAVTTAKETIGLDTADVRLIAAYLKDTSDNFLTRCEGNPRQALDEITDFFAEKLSSSGKKYDRMAIKFYLLSELIGCNVFPNEEK